MNTSKPKNRRRPIKPKNTENTTNRKSSRLAKKKEIEDAKKREALNELEIGNSASIQQVSECKYIYIYIYIVSTYLITIHTINISHYNTY